MPVIRPSDNFLGHDPPGPWQLGLVLGPGRACDGTANLGARSFVFAFRARPFLRLQRARKAFFTTSVRATNYCLWRCLVVFLHGDTWSFSFMAALGRFP